MKRRDAGLLLSAVIITSMCTWRVLTPPRSIQSGSQLPEERRAAPEFELYDQQSKRLSLSAYLHRHPVVLVFFDGSESADNLPIVTRIREVFPALRRNGVVVLGISNMLPQTARKQATAEFPFPVLSDITAGRRDSVSVQWGCAALLSESEAVAGAARIQTKTFLIDRAGLVAWDGQFPQAVTDENQLINDLLSGI